MPVQAQWDDDSAARILVFVFEGDWTWHECRDAMQTAEFLAEDMDSPISHVYDLSNSRLPQRAYVTILQKILTTRFSHVIKRTVIIERAHFIDTLRNMLAFAIMEQDMHTVHFADNIMRARVIAHTD